MTNQEAVQAVQIEKVTHSESGVTMAKLRQGEDGYVIRKFPKKQGGETEIQKDPKAFSSGLTTAGQLTKLEGEEKDTTVKSLQEAKLEGSKKDVKAVQKLLKDMQKTK